MLNIKTINDKNIGVVEIKSTEIFKDYFDREVIIHKLDKQAYLKEMHYKPLKGFKWIVNNIELKPMFRLSVNPDTKFVILPFFKKPVEFCLMYFKQYGIFRLIPHLPYLAINESGILYNLITNKFVTPIKGNYTTVITNGIKLVLHRLVALVWCDNDDYVKKYVVDHIDQNKENYNKNNLRWLSNKANVARSHSNNKGIPVDRRWLVYSSNKNRVFEFTGLKEIDKFFKIPYRNINARSFPFLYTLPDGEVLVFEDKHNFKNWELKKKISAYGYRYKTYEKNNGDVRYFKKLDDVLKIYGLKEFIYNKSKNGGIFNSVRLDLLKKNIVLQDVSFKKMYNQFSKNKYTIEAKNLKTGKILNMPSTRLYGEYFNINKSIFITRLNGNIREGLPYVDKNGDQWLFRKSNMEWPAIVVPKKVFKKVGVFENGKLKITFNSIREASNNLNIGRHLLTKMLNDENEVKFKYVV